MTQPAAADQAEHPAIDLGSLAGRHSSAQGAVPWWVSAPLLAAGFAVLVLGDGEGWSHRLGTGLAIVGAVLLGQRYGLRATSELSPQHVRLKGYYGRRVDVPWSAVTEVIPARLPSGRSRVRLVDGRRVLLGGLTAAQARRLQRAVDRSRAAR